MKYIFIFLVVAGCATESSDRPFSVPEWTKAPTRTVDNGYIVYIGSGEDSAKDRASFKAEGAALQDLANECSFVPKGTRLEDRFDKVEGSLHESYAKVAVEFVVGTRLRPVVLAGANRPARHASAQSPS